MKTMNGQAAPFVPLELATTSQVDVMIAMRTDTNVLLTGPQETAVEVARRVHDESGWRHGPFTVIDCSDHAGLERRLAEALSAVIPEIVGPRPRLLQAGTILLKEIGRMPGDLQRPLANQLVDLRKGIRSRPRIVATTSEPLLERVLDGTFDDHLYYRLNTIHLRLGE